MVGSYLSGSIVCLKSNECAFRVFSHYHESSLNQHFYVPNPPLSHSKHLDIKAHTAQPLSAQITQSTSHLKRMNKSLVVHWKVSLQLCLAPLHASVSASARARRVRAPFAERGRRTLTFPTLFSGQPQFALPAQKIVWNWSAFQRSQLKAVSDHPLVYQNGIEEHLGLYFAGRVLDSWCLTFSKCKLIFWAHLWCGVS